MNKIIRHYWPVEDRATRRWRLPKNMEQEKLFLWTLHHTNGALDLLPPNSGWQTAWINGLHAVTEAEENTDNVHDTAGALRWAESFVKSCIYSHTGIQELFVLNSLWSNVVESDPTWWQRGQNQIFYACGGPNWDSWLKFPTLSSVKGC